MPFSVPARTILALALAAWIAPQASFAFGSKPVVAASIYCENRRDLTGDRFTVQSFRLDLGPSTVEPFEVHGYIKLDSAFERPIDTTATGILRADLADLKIQDLGTLQIRRERDGTYSGAATFFSKPSADDLLCSLK